MAGNVKIGATEAKATDDKPAEEVAKEALTEAESSDTVAAPDGPRIHMDRPVGGKYVSLGAGERVWVPEADVDPASLDADDPRIDDTDFKARQPK